MGNIGSVNDVFDAQIKAQNDFDGLTEATKKPLISSRNREILKP